MIRILYVEDYQAAATTMDYVLAELGHECVVAATGREAIEAYDRLSFDLILIDSELPDMSGPDVARAIRRREKESGRPHTILLAFSAGTQDGVTFQDAGMDGFALKTLSMNDIKRLLAEYLGNQLPSDREAGRPTDLP